MITSSLASRAGPCSVVLISPPTLWRLLLARPVGRLRPRSPDDQRPDRSLAFVSTQPTGRRCLAGDASMGSPPPIHAPASTPPRASVPAFCCFLFLARRFRIGHSSRKL